MKQLLKWQMAMFIPLLCLAIYSCGDEKDEPNSDPDVSETPVNIEDIIIGTWECNTDSMEVTATFKEDNMVYLKYDGKPAWTLENYMIVGNKIIFTEVSDWFGQETDVEYALENRSVWEVEYKGNKLHVIDDYGDRFVMAKAQKDPVYAHYIVGKWLLEEQDYVETMQFDIDGKFKREVFIGQRPYASYYGTYELRPNQFVFINITSSDSNPNFTDEVVYNYYFGVSGMILYDISGEVGTFTKMQ